jgi:ubiquinone/menaquinone biosynthesis C-methylase UbiE
MDSAKFKEFFEPYAKNVDKANSQAFWKLSDKLITEIIKLHIPASLTEDQTILDAGGGTARWACELSSTFKAKFIVYDLSEDMLSVARNNVTEAGLAERVTLMQGDLKDMAALADNSVDHIISIYSPLSFIYEKNEALRELFRILKPGGKIIIMGHGYFNALSSKINNYLAPAEELQMMAEEQMVQWGEHVPKLNIFSKEIMEEDLAKAGFSIITTHGVPVFVQPGAEDFDPTNAKQSRISSALENPEFFNKVFELEMKYNADPAVANRGMNIFSVATK